METKEHIDWSMSEGESLSALKKAIRHKVLRARNEMQPAERARTSLIVTERLLGHQWFYGSENILCFASFGSELDTAEIIKEAIRMKKNLFLPKITDKVMEFYKIEDGKELISGFRGIKEPDGTKERFQYTEEVASKTLMIMPGVAFDHMRRRIGYGKGFYDRYLSDKEGLCLRTIAIGFSCQLTESIPEGDFDVRPYQLILA